MFPECELILHRANTMERINDPLNSVFQRLEVDLRWKPRKMRIVVSHDRTFGPLAYGRNGTGLHSRPWAQIRWPHLKPQEFFETEPLPLLIDLKGSWPNAGLRALLPFMRNEDMIGTSSIELLLRHQRIEPERHRILFDAHRNLQAPILTAHDRPFTGVSIDAQEIGSNLWIVKRLHRLGLRVYAVNIHTQKKLRDLQRSNINGAILRLAPHNLKPR